MTLSSQLFVFLSTWGVIRNGTREERWEGRPKGMVCKVELFCFYKKLRFQLLPSEIVYPNIKLL